MLGNEKLLSDHCWPTNCNSCRLSVTGASVQPQREI